jgi:hypothetical protein
MARSIARAVRGASGMVTTLPSLRVMVSVRWPRSVPSASMLAPVASETAARSRRAWGSAHARRAGPDLRRPAARRVRCGPARWRATHSPGGTADMSGLGVVEELLLDGVPAEPGDRA